MRRYSYPISLLLFLCAAPVFGQVPPKSDPVVDRLIFRADSLVAHHKYSDARDLYDAALWKDKTSLPAVIGMARIGLAERSWSGTIDWCEKALGLDADNLDARYYLGRAYAEQGRARYLLEKIFGFFTKSSFEKARMYLGEVIAKDSLYRDVFYQLALVSCFERDYWGAVPIVLKQIKLKPELRSGHSGVYNIYRLAVAMSPGSNPPSRLGRPTGDYDRFFLAEWQRKKGRLEEAESTLQALERSSSKFPRQLILQSRARIRAGQGKNDEVERLVTESIGAVGTLAEADLVFEDIKYIISDQELDEYRSLTSAPEARRFLAVFWAKRNPYPAEASNSRIAEHYRRLVYAEQYFEQFGRKSFAEETMPLDFPETYYLNEEFNDKGLIYLRHGEPHQKILTARSADGPAESNESWLYYRTDEYPEMFFDFFIPPSAHVTEWRLVPVLSDPYMWADRMEYSHKYLRLAQSQSTVNRIANMAIATDEGKQTASTGVSMDRFSFTKDLKYYDSPVSLTCYRGTRSKTLVELGYVIVPNEIAKGLPDSVHRFSVDAQYSMYNASWERAAGSQDTKIYQRTKESGGVSIELFHAAVKPDSYVVAWQAKPAQTNEVFSQKLQVFVPDFSGTALNMSDLELAYLIEPARSATIFMKGDLSVIPNPVRKCRLDRPLYLYFEAYNLTKDSRGKTSYTVEYRLTSLELEKSFLARIFTRGKKSSISVPSERTGNSDWSREHIAIDVSELEPGKYQLQATLTDNLSRASVSRSIVVSIYKAE